MRALEGMKTRLQYSGGVNQQDRMNQDKLRVLKKALLYSYQAATAILEDGREFRCLINPDKLKTSYDEKIISIPYEDICLNPEFSKRETTSQGIESIDLLPGDVFTWKENNTKWLVYLKRYEETAYLRAEIRRCNYRIEINGSYYDVYAKGPDETAIVWNKVKSTMWNNLNYNLTMYIKKDRKTENFFHRFSKIELNNMPWEVQAIDSMSLEGVIIVALRETYQNSIEKELEKENEECDIIERDGVTPYINGPLEINPYDTIKYKVEKISEEELTGEWKITGKRINILEENSSYIVFQENSGHQGEIEIKYKRKGKADLLLPVKVNSL